MRLEQMKETGINHTVVKTGDPRWVRVFVQRSDGCQIGRLSFHDGVLYSSKWYKSDMYRMPFDDSDFVQAQFESYVHTGKPITAFEYAALRAKVEAYCAADLRRKQAKRDELPKKSRKKLHGFDPRALLHRVLKGYNTL